MIVGCPIVVKEAMFAPGLPDKGKYDPIDKMKGLTRMVIQKHQATQDHYDYRIQQDDIAHSWAAKYLPKDKKKLMLFRQPSHTAEYMDFEGTISEGYGAGKVKKIYDQVIDIVNSSEDKINFVLPEGEFAMIKMQGKNPNWLLVEKNPVINAVNSKPKYKEVLPDEIDLEDENTVLEPKIDGAHNIFELHSDNINRIYSYKDKKGDDIAIDHTHQVPILRDAVVPKELDGTLLRGEIFAKDLEGNILPSTSIAGLLNANPIKSRLKQKEIGFLEPRIFDIVSYKGDNVEDDGYRDKLKMLKNIEKIVPEMKMSEVAYSPGEKKKMFDKIKNDQHPDTREGIILWDLNKSKPIRAKFKDNYEVYIRKIFKAESKSGKDFAGGFEFSWTPRGKVVGRIGTGFTAALRKDMWENPNEYVGRIARVKSQEKYESGALRAPSFYDFHMESLLKGAGMKCPGIIKRVRI